MATRKETWISSQHVWHDRDGTYQGGPAAISIRDGIVTQILTDKTLISERQKSIYEKGGEWQDLGDLPDRDDPRDRAAHQISAEGGAARADGSFGTSTSLRGESDLRMDVVRKLKDIRAALAEAVGD